MTTNTCPICGAEGLEVHEKNVEVGVPFGPKIAVREIENTCPTCGESGDFGNENDARIEAARKQSALASIPVLLERLTKSGRSMAYIERALELPPRTCARWRSGEGTSAGALALLRMLATFPWTIEVADAGYDPTAADVAVLKHSVEVVASALAKQGMVPHAVSLEASASAANLTVFMRPPVPQPSLPEPSRLVLKSS